jgi:hypothetical protein
MYDSDYLLNNIPALIEKAEFVTFIKLHESKRKKWGDIFDGIDNVDRKKLVELLLKLKQKYGNIANSSPDYWDGDDINFHRKIENIYYLLNVWLFILDEPRFKYDRQIAEFILLLSKNPCECPKDYDYIDSFEFYITILILTSFLKEKQHSIAPPRTNYYWLIELLSELSFRYVRLRVIESTSSNKDEFINDKLEAEYNATIIDISHQLSKYLFIGTRNDGSIVAPNYSFMSRDLENDIIKYLWCLSKNPTENPLKFNKR